MQIYSIMLDSIRSTQSFEKQPSWTVTVCQVTDFISQHVLMGTAIYLLLMTFPLLGKGLLFLKLSIAKLFFLILKVCYFYYLRKSLIGAIFKYFLYVHYRSYHCLFLFSNVSRSSIVLFLFFQVMLIVDLCVEQCLQ